MHAVVEARGSLKETLAQDHVAPIVAAVGLHINILVGHQSGSLPSHFEGRCHHTLVIYAITL